MNVHTQPVYRRPEPPVQVVLPEVTEGQGLISGEPIKPLKPLQLTVVLDTSEAEVKLAEFADKVVRLSDVFEGLVVALKEAEKASVILTEEMVKQDLPVVSDKVEETE